MAEVHCPDAPIRPALAHVEEHGFGDSVDDDAIILKAARGLVAIYDKGDLGGDPDGSDSAADTCEKLYALMGQLGLEVP